MKAFLIAALLTVTALAFAQDQPALGDVARSAKQTKKAARVITNDEIPSKPEPAPEAKASDPATAPDAPKGEAKAEEAVSPSDAPKSSSVSNAEAVKIAQANLDSAKGKLAEAQRDVEDLQTQVDDAKDKASKDSLKSLLQSKQEYRDTLNKQVAEMARLLQEAEQVAANPNAEVPKGPAY